MVDERFEEWLATARCVERCAAAQQLCDLVGESVGRPDALLSELLHRFAEDPSPKVRMVLAQSLCEDWRAPPTLMRLLASDIDAIAVLVARSSTLLGGDDLLDLVLTGSSMIRVAVARRTPLTARLSTAIVDSGDPVACHALLENSEAPISSDLLERIGEIAEGDPILREHLVRRTGLPANLRQILTRAVARDLSRTGLVANLLGARAERLADEACRTATVSIAAQIARSDLSRFSDRLRQSGEISTILLAEAALSGELDFFAASLASLSGLPDMRVRRMIVDTRDAPLRALLARAGIPASAQALLLIAVRHWKDAAQGGIDERSADTVLDGIASAFITMPAGEGHGELVRLIGRLRTHAASRRGTRSHEPALRRAA